MKVVITAELKNSINNAPTKGNIKNALGDGPYLFGTDSILDIPLGVVPMPKPQFPADNAAYV